MDCLDSSEVSSQLSVGRLRQVARHASVRLCGLPARVNRVKLEQFRALAGNGQHLLLQQLLAIQ